MDEFGDPEVGQTQTYEIEGIRESFQASYALLYGIPQTDVKILLILGLIKPATTPRKDDKIYIRGQWHQVRKVLELDPAQASITLQCFEIEDPT